MSRHPAAALPAVLAAALLLAGCAWLQPGPAPTGSATPSGPPAVPLTELKAGDCYDEASSGVAIVDCAEPHAYEVIAAFVVPNASYPGATIDAEVQPTCTQAFADFVGIDYDASVLTLRTIAPSSATWDEGSRQALCVVYDPSGDTTGSLRGTAK